MPFGKSSKIPRGTYSVVSKAQDEQEGPPSPPSPPASFPYYVSASTPDLHEELFTKIVDLLLRKGLFYNSRNERRKSPFQFKRPEVLQKMMDFTLGSAPLVNNSSDSKAGVEALMKIMEFVIDYSPHPSHPFMVSKNLSGLDPYGIVGDWLSTTMSAPVLTYVLAPVFTLMEFEVEEKFRNLLGYPANQGDGMVTPGQGIGNSYIIQVALQTKFKEYKDKGVYNSNSKGVMFVSEQADYGYEKYCIWEGIGESACVRVKTDSKGRMNVGALKSAISCAKSSGLVPFLIVATAGTNVLGAIDPIDEIATVASEEKAWFHVDGHLAASCIFSPNQKQRLKGIERSDSCLWSPEKMLAAPFCMSIVVTKESRKMKETFSYGAAIIFDQGSFYDHDKWDNGDNTMQTTRRPDILKIWLMWKAKGRKGLGDQVDGTYENTGICVEELKKRKGRFELVLREYDSNLVSFYYIPQLVRFQATFGGQKTITRLIKNNKVTETVKNMMLEQGKMEISLGELPGRDDLPKFFIMNMNNTALTRKDIVYMLDLIEFYGEKVLIVNQFRSDETTTGQDSVPPETNNEDVRLQLTAREPTVPDPPATYPDYVSAPIESMHRNLFEEYFKVAFEIGTYFQNRRNEPPAIFKQPEDLLRDFDFSLGETGGGDGPSGYKDVATLMKIVKNIIYFSPHLGHPYYIFQLVSGLDPYTMMADYVVGCMTSSMYTYEDGPVYTLMEDALNAALLHRTGASRGCGLSFVGGSISNQFPMMLAYLNKAPESKQKGNLSVGAPGVIFCSEAAQFSTPKGVFFQGTGLNHLALVKTDKTGKMDVEDLRNKVNDAVKNGKVPMMVTATGGTTTLGAYDAAEAIADICEEHRMWFHLDGAYGGCIIMSDNEKYRLKGIERADSFTMNPHKMLAAARYTTIWVSKHEDILRRAAPPPSKQYYRLNPDLYNGAKYDHGETHPQTDRRPDVFKLWLLWKAKGQQGLQDHVDRAYQLTKYAQKRLEQLKAENRRFQPLLSTPPECTNVNFQYVPQVLLTMDPNSAGYKERLICVQNALLATMIFKNKIVLSVEALPNYPEHLIFCLYNTCITEEDIDYFLALIDYFGQRLPLDKIFASCDQREEDEKGQSRDTSGQKVIAYA